MLHYIYGSDLDLFPRLRDTMFRDRAEQFHHRLGWDVSLNGDGQERDEYDEMNPLYAVWELPNGSHGGSMRFLPTDGPTMMNDHFGHLAMGRRISDPRIWECTRFCISPRADRKAGAALVLAGGEIMGNFGLTHFCGVFDVRMQRIYRLYKVSPVVLGSEGEGALKISLGLWDTKPAAWMPILTRLGISRETSVRWFRQSLAGSVASARAGLALT
jgi:acyl homoserine lactone synthase